MEQEHISDEMFWGISLSALTMQSIGNCNHRSLFGFDGKDDSVKAFLKSYLYSIGIFNAKEAKDRLYHYRHDLMHNRMFRETTDSLNLFSEDEFNAYINTLETPLDVKRSKIAWCYRHELKETGIRGYDIAQYVMLMRVYGAYGYLEENEIRLRLYDIAEEVHQKFDSWDHYHQNILAGDQYVKGYEMHDHNSIITTNPLIKAYYSIMNSSKQPGSPFYQLNWLQQN